MGTYTERARALRPFIIKAAASLSDADALQAKELYARWAAGMVSSREIVLYMQSMV